jgi:hypothetical protein
MTVPRIRRVAGALTATLLAVALAGCASPPTTPAAPASTPASTTPAGAAPTVVSDSSLPRTPLAQFSDGLLPGSVAGADGGDHGITLGGIGSDIYPADAPDEYWMITDRGPNGQVKVDGKNRRTFPVPGFDPAILRVKVQGPTLAVQQAFPLTGSDGKAVTGLSDLTGHDETPYELTATTTLPFNPSGLDTEGLVRLPNGEFWVSEEYSPSLLRVSPTGQVLARYVPEGLTLPGADYPVNATLPAVLAKRQINRGFESLALDPDGHTLYTALQSPLALPDDKAGGKSRSVRLLAVDTATGKAGAEYVYRFDDVDGFDPAADGDESEMKISALAWFGPGQLLVDERTDDVTKLYLARLTGATNILGGPFDDPAGETPLEQADLADSSVTPLAKSLLLDLTASVPGAPKKVEGLAVRDPRTVVVTNDNDFGMRDGADGFGPDGRQRDTGVPSRLLVLRLPG